MKNLIILFATLVVAQANGQTLFVVRDSIDVNNINALSLVHGDMWWNPEVGKSGCFFQAVTRKNFSFAGALWMGGYDASGQLHVAAQTYRHTGTDYWPGPLDGSGNLDHATAEKWAKIWKVRRSEINAYLATPFHRVSNTPESILTWPAKGNTHAKGKDGAPLSITTDMAPFIDHDGDGLYNPLRGDYPAIKGEQTLWYVFSDNGPTHSQTNGAPLKVEVQALVYAYNRGTLIDNVVYYDYTIVNKSDENYNDFRLALWNDVSTEYYIDNFIGFDSVRRLAIAYGVTYEGGISGFPPNPYGTRPASGVTFVSLPGDASPAYVPAGSFMFIRNDASRCGNPTLPIEYQYYMNSRWKNGAHLKYDSNNYFHVRPFDLIEAGDDKNYVFSEDPSVWRGFSECALGNNPGDRMTVLASNSFTLKAGISEHIVMALVVDTGAGGCPSVDLSGLKTVADTAWGVYRDATTFQPIDYSDHYNKGILIYPNPAYDRLQIDQNFGYGDIRYTIYDMVGRRMHTDMLNRSTTIVDISSFPAGVYILSYRRDGIAGKEVFVKQ